MCQCVSQNFYIYQYEIYTRYKKSRKFSHFTLALEGFMLGEFIKNVGRYHDCPYPRVRNFYYLEKQV